MGSLVVSLPAELVVHIRFGPHHLPSDFLVADNCNSNSKGALYGKWYCFFGGARYIKQEWFSRESEKRALEGRGLPKFMRFPMPGLISAPTKPTLKRERIGTVFGQERTK